MPNCLQSKYGNSAPDTEHIMKCAKFYARTSNKFSQRAHDEHTNDRKAKAIAILLQQQNKMEKLLQKLH